MRISDWSSDVCSSDLLAVEVHQAHEAEPEHRHRIAEQAEQAHDVVGPAALVDRRDDAGGDADEDAEEGGDGGEFQGGRKHPGDVLGHRPRGQQRGRSEEHTSELPSLMRISYAVFCLKKKKKETT